MSTKRIRNFGWSIACFVSVLGSIVTYLVAVPPPNPDWTAYQRGLVFLQALSSGLQVGIPLFVAIGLGAELAVAVLRHRTREPGPVERAVDWIDGTSTMRDRTKAPPAQNGAEALAAHTRAAD